MNKRIEELADLCWQQTGQGFLPLPKDSRLSYEDSAYEFDYEKFAELIVKDCLDLVENELVIADRVDHNPLGNVHLFINIVCAFDDKFRVKK